MIRALIAEDSVTVRELLKSMLESDPEISVVGEAKDGEEAVRLTETLAPDVVTMDIRMPLMDGFAATKEIMVVKPTPIVIVSGHGNVHDAEFSVKALSAGALDVFPKPEGPSDPEFETIRRQFCGRIKRMATVKVIRRRRRPAPEELAKLPSLPSLPPAVK